MDLKKLLLSLAISVPLAAAGCGDDNGVDPGPDPCEGVDPNDDIWEMTRLALPDPDDPTDVIGFDLDGVDNSPGAEEPGPTPEEGCGIFDLAGGVDNVIGMLLPLVGELASGLDVQAAIDDAIADGAVSIVASIKNYDGAGSTGVTLSLVLNGDVVPALQDVPATVDGAGNIRAEIDSLPLTLENLPIEDAMVDLVLDISNAIVEVAAPTGNTSTAIIGGAILYGDENSGPNAFRSQIENLIETLDLGDLGIEDVDLIIGNLLDMSSDGVNCDSLSIGARATFSRIVCD
jgi:hypothetical protein